MLTTQRPEGLKELPPSKGRVAEGGLRTKCCFKASANEKPLISIIVVVLNRANCFENCIQSILGQSYDNVEFIIIDGGSNDGSLDLLRKYSDKIDYWVSEPDQGLYYAMNKAVGIACGEWLYFIGADDVMLNCLSTVVPQLKNNQSVYYGDVYGVGSTNRYNGPFSPYRLQVNGLNHQGMFFPRGIFSAYRYDTKYKFAADFDLNLRCLIEGGYQFVYLHELIAQYNDVDGWSSDGRPVLREFREIIHKRRGIRGYFYIGCLLLISLRDALRCKERFEKLFLNWKW